VDGAELPLAAGQGVDDDEGRPSLPTDTPRPQRSSPSSRPSSMVAELLTASSQ